MGTRASFWIGDPRDLKNRELLGCIAWDGYPEGLPESFFSAKTEAEFRSEVDKVKRERIGDPDFRDFALPERGWPFPWDRNIFLTDFTYAFFDEEVKIAYFNRGFWNIAELSRWSKEDKFGEEPFQGRILSEDCPAPSTYNPEQPDSIMIFGVK